MPLALASSVGMSPVSEPATVSLSAKMRRRHSERWSRRVNVLRKNSPAYSSSLISHLYYPLAWGLVEAPPTGDHGRRYLLRLMAARSRSSGSPTLDLISRTPLSRGSTP